MQPLVQSAIDAANRGENDKALELCKQALAADPNDVDAWLVVAAVVEQPERKRQCLNRVLSLDPTNQIARDELLDMDRAAMGDAPPSSMESASQPTYSSEPPLSSYPDGASAFEPEPKPSAPAPAFSGTKFFKKSFFKQYGSYFLSVPLCLFAVGAVFTEPRYDYKLGALIIIIACVGMMIFPLFEVNAIKVEPNKLTIETLFTQKVFSARQIREIKMQSVRGRRGRVTNLLNIIPVKGKNYPLQGFSTGEKVICDFLINWWNAYRNR